MDVREGDSMKVVDLQGRSGEKKPVGDLSLVSHLKGGEKNKTKGGHKGVRGKHPKRKEKNKKKTKQTLAQIKNFRLALPKSSKNDKGGGFRLSMGAKRTSMGFPEEIEAWGRGPAICRCRKGNVRSRLKVLEKGGTRHPKKKKKNPSKDLGGEGHLEVR